MQKLYVCSLVFMSLVACKQKRPDRGAIPETPTCQKDLLLATDPAIMDTNRVGFGLTGLDRSEGLALLSLPVGDKKLPDEVKGFVKDGVLVLAMGVKDMHVTERVSLNLTTPKPGAVKKPGGSGSTNRPDGPDGRTGGGLPDVSRPDGGVDDNGLIMKDPGVDIKGKEGTEGEKTGAAASADTVQKQSVLKKLSDGVKTKWASVKKWSDDNPRFAKMGRWGVGVGGLALLYYVATQDDDPEMIYVFGEDLPKELTETAPASEATPEESATASSSDDKASEDDNATASASPSGQENSSSSDATGSVSDPNVVTLDVGSTADETTAHVVDTENGEISNITVGVNGEHEALQDPTLSQSCGG